MKRDDRVYLQHILDSAEVIEDYLSDVSESTFQKRRLIQDGVIRQLEVIGEAVKHISKALRSSNPQIPWQDIAGMRDKLIHHYFGVDLDQVWLAETEELPLIRAEVQVILETFVADDV